MTTKEIDDDDMLPEYDFSHGVRGKYFREAMLNRGLVEIDADLRKQFPDSDAVNKALRSLVSKSAKNSNRRPQAKSTQSVQKAENVVRESPKAAYTPKTSKGAPQSSPNSSKK